MTGHPFSTGIVAPDGSPVDIYRAMPPPAGPVGITVTRASVEGDEVSASVRYDLDGKMWDQPFTARLLDEAALRRRLAEAGLAFERWLDAGRGRFLAGTIQGAGSSPTTRADQGQ